MENNQESIPRMRSIPHLDDMDFSDVVDFISDLKDNNYEIAEKVDAVNYSVTTRDGKSTIGKSKRSKPSPDPKFFYDLEHIHPVFKTMGQLIEDLNKADFPRWLFSAIKKYKSEIDKAAESEVIGVSIFGELFSSNQTNTLIYSKDSIGSGAFVVFGCIAYTSTSKSTGIDISATNIGIEIMKEFVEEFNGINGFKIYFKNIIDIKLNSSFITSLQKFVDKYSQDILSRKRGPEVLKKKEEAKNKLVELLKAFKRDILPRVKKTKSFLGADEIEGVVIRNKATGGITKVVDKSEFTRRNRQNWESNDKFMESKLSFIQSIVDSVLKSADIFMSRAKQTEKLSDYLVEQDIKKFNDFNEIVDVLCRDAMTEVTLDNPQKILSTLTALTNEYLESLKAIETEYTTKQKTKDAMSENNFNSLLRSISDERKIVNDILKETRSAVNSENPIGPVIPYILGHRVISDLSEKFVS